MKKLKALAAPCKSCPYRTDVPSGIWDQSEYDKLPGYDGEMWQQAHGVFLCHQKNGSLCSGWLACHGPHNLLSLRMSAVIRGDIDPSVFDYVTHVPVFSSGAEARAHGIAAIEQPTISAREMATRLRKKQRRARKTG